MAIDGTYTIEARNYHMGGGAGHNYWVLRDNFGNVVKEMHGLSTNPKTGEALQMLKKFRKISPICYFIVFILLLVLIAYAIHPALSVALYLAVEFWPTKNNLNKKRRK